jgi:hypothetical protein
VSSKERPAKANLSGKRRSASADASRQAQIERDWQMSPLERMEQALALGRRRQELIKLRNSEPDDNA